MYIVCRGGNGDSPEEMEVKFVAGWTDFFSKLSSSGRLHVTSDEVHDAVCLIKLTRSPMRILG